MNHVTATDQTQLYVKDWGSGRPVILIHGWPLRADSWDDQQRWIAGTRKVFHDLPPPEW
jgi:non-heme chloroperoxidase